MPVTKPKHTAAAIRIAEILAGGKYGGRKRYSTAYGSKTVEGIADLIESELELPRLLTDTKELLHYTVTDHVSEHDDPDTGYCGRPRKDCLVCGWLGQVALLIKKIEKGAK